METRHMEGQSLVSGAGMSVPMRSLEGQAWDGLAQSLGGCGVEASGGQARDSGSILTVTPVQLTISLPAHFPVPSPPECLWGLLSPLLSKPLASVVVCRGCHDKVPRPWRLSYCLSVLETSSLRSVRGWGVRENLFQVSLLASAGFLATFGLHWLTDTEPLASFILTWSVRVCFQMSPFVRIQVMLAKNQANDFILTNYIVFPNRVTGKGTGGEDAHITRRDMIS